MRIARSAVLSAPGCPTSQSCASRRAQWNGTLSRCTPADRSRSTTALVTPAPAVQSPRFSGRSSDEIVEQGRQVGAAKRISATDQEGAGPAGDGARGAQDVARRKLIVRPPRAIASPRQPGRTANQRDTEIDAPNRG